MTDKSYTKAIHGRLYDVFFPCYLVVHGYGDSSRTKYHSEYEGCFGHGGFETEKQAVEFIEKLNYEGSLQDLTILSFSLGFKEA